MDTERDRLFAVIFHGWVEVLTLFMLLFAALTAWGWAANRRAPPDRRSASTPWGILLLTFALVMIMRAFNEAWPQALTIAGSVLALGFINRRADRHWAWTAAVLLAALLGMGWIVAALALSVVGFVAFRFIRPRA